MNFLKDYLRCENGSTITGLTNELNVILIFQYFEKIKDNVIVLTNSLFEANKIYENLKAYTEDVLLFPMDDFLTSMILAVSPELKIKRLETLEKIKTNKKSIVVTNLMGFLRFLPNKEMTQKFTFRLAKDQQINRNKLSEILDNFGYSKESLVTATGEYAVRGFVVDIFLIQEIHPIRIEFFGNKIESIRYFDESTQISIKALPEIDCKPYNEIKTTKNSSLFDYLNNPSVIFVDNNQIRAGYHKLCEEITDYSKDSKTKPNDHMFLLEDFNIKNSLYIETYSDSAKNNKVFRYETNELQNFNSDFELLKQFVQRYQKNNKTIVFCLSNSSQTQKIKSLIPSAIISREIIMGKINIIEKRINRGFIIGDLVVIGEYDIENVSSKPINYKNTFRMGRKLKGFDDLKTGDYVVHILHGIGIYKGVITLTKNKIKKDYLQIDYLGNDKVYIPVEKIDVIYKYSDKDGTKPKLSKLGTTAWEKKKRELRSKITDISGMLIELYAKRQSVPGVAFKKYIEEEIFASEFIYQLTEDQIKAINEIEKDLLIKTPMDRLLCGDVGFGKTEVAFRAMYKTVMNNHQVLYLCPTTILSKQQYSSALERFANHPINIALLNRFTTKKEATKIIEDLMNGRIDILFGTHRLLSSDIKPDRLGLLVVDEEQRFGVTHKEKIKSLKNNVNVLTLSATPIPRTLKMSLSGLRDLSLIDTAPAERYPVQTYVMSENDMLIKDAIYKELSRGGQIFILYNQVESIEKQVSKISRLAPDAKISYAHGQMSKMELENVMISFVKHESDILVCTTIIETGIDIPNVNTLIIFDADKFGLSQLYQIRGRVGRSNKIAYAYLLYRKDKMLNDIAIKRLQSIKEFTELGSGYKIALRDLSIRGAGDILGSEQAGFVSTVGIELYMKMIEDEIKRQKGEIVESEDKIDNNSLLNVETHISDVYVDDEEVKIEIHKKINEIDNREMFVEVKEELEDRFGQIPGNILIYMYEEWFEKLAKKLNINKVNQNNASVEIELSEDLVNKIGGDKLFILTNKINSKFILKQLHRRVLVTLPTTNLEKHFVFYLVPLLNMLNDNN